MVMELSKALSQIGAVLPRVEMQLGLYGTGEMKVQVELLYAQIIQFYQRALKWYKGGKLKHIFAAFANPYPLQFKDLKDKIEEHSRNIEKQAAVYAQVELRHVTVLAQSNFQSSTSILSLLTELRTMMIGQ
jgi:hypothetical protein